MDRALLRTASRQHGAFARDQARDCGLTRSAIRHRRSSGRWEEAVEGVYLVPGSPRTWQQKLIAAVFAAGTGACVSHRAAAALWVLPGFRRGPVEVTRPRGRHEGSPAGTVHESRVLPPQSIRVRDGIPVTSPARTLFDLASVVPAKRVERAVDNALSARLVTLTDLWAELVRLQGRGRRGIQAMRAILAERTDTYIPPDSELEAKLLEVLEWGGLPEPERQHWVGGGERPAGRVDLVYAWARLVIEADSRRHHMSLLDFEADRVRDGELAAAGYRVVRVTWWRLLARPDEVVDVVRRALDA